MGSNIWEQLAITVLITTLQASIKNPASKARLKAVLLKIYGLIALMYAGDEDFNPLAAASHQEAKLAKMHAAALESEVELG